MSVLFRLFLDIALFRRGPQDVPDSPILLALAVLADVAISTVVGALEGDVLGAMLQALVASALLLAFVATLYPSWRASQVNPAEALRYE